MEPPDIGSPLLFTGFGILVLVMLALDLGVFHRKAHVMRVREAAAWSVVWVLLALAFGAGIWHLRGADPAIAYLTGYVLEKSLSVDNLFVFVVVFSTLGIPARFQHRVLFWGVLGALVFRAAMILAGSALLERFHWLMEAFGALLIVTGVKLFVARGKAPLEDSRMLALVRRAIPSTSYLDGGRFWTRQNGRLLATPLFVALLLVEVTDVAFAVDSIPAVFGITSDPFIVFTSNVFAILGLRSLYGVLAHAVDRMTYLKVGLSLVLVVIGAKMTLGRIVDVSPLASLAIVGSILGAATVASLLAAPAAAREERPRAAPP
ncbi:MAG: TerC family protein [Acidobacteriota bacterium]